MVDSAEGVIDSSKVMAQTMLDSPQSPPQDSLFRDASFEVTCRKIHNRNEARVIRDISRLIVPSAENLATYGAAHLGILAESVNEGWNCSIPLTRTRPQPDYSVGFQREAFTDAQLARLSPFIGDVTSGDLSHFTATYYIYLPFLASEVKCGTSALEFADRQNAHSMTLGVWGIVELFRLTNREHEVHRQILAWSISHDDRTVRIYGHYPVVAGKDTKYYRHAIHTFDFTARQGRERWTAYQFTKNVYDTWMPDHFKRICSVIDQLPERLDSSSQGLSDMMDLSQDLHSHPLVPPEAISASLPAVEDESSVHADETTSPPSPSPKPRSGTRKKRPKKRW